MHDVLLMRNTGPAVTQSGDHAGAVLVPR